MNELLTNPLFWCFSGYIPALFGMILSFMSDSEKVKRYEVFTWSLLGLIPFIGNIIGGVMFIYGLWLHIYKDHEEWWKYEE